MSPNKQAEVHSKDKEKLIKLKMELGIKQRQKIFFNS